ncbi:MAG: acyltransferase family protein, partial [Hyphomonas sp.]|nr:acyltransferase family protein [Hyphomonas sp.]
MTGILPSPPAESVSASHRLDALDGLRGIAAVLVVIYHFTARWTERENGESLYPHGDGLLEALPFVNLLGLYGVSLFFLISGFVIIMTLERSTGIADFAVRRASRLWPTMIVCATLTTLLISLSGIHLRFESIAEWEIQPIEYLSSIVF